MPHVLPFSEVERKKVVFSKWIKGKKAMEDVTNAMIGAELGMTGQAVGQKNKKCQYDFGELILLLKKLNATDEEILSLMKL